MAIYIRQIDFITTKHLILIYFNFYVSKLLLYLFYTRIIEKNLRVYSLLIIRKKCEFRRIFLGNSSKKHQHVYFKHRTSIFYIFFNQSYRLIYIQS